MRTLIRTLAISSLFLATTASAQTYYSGACLNLTNDLSIGSRAGEVTQLQQFLVNQNYPGGGSWMVTGYFGQATAAAVRNFQQSAGLAMTGIVDSATRAAMNARSCGYAAPSTYGYSAPYTYDYTNYNYGYTYPYTGTYAYGSLTLTSLSANTGQPGSSITVYGTGFDYTSNTVYLGAVAVANVSSTNGTSLTFPIPSYVSLGATTIKVSNARGTSNTLSFTVLSSPYACGPYYTGYASVNCGGCPAGANCDARTGAPTITVVTPEAGGAGSTVNVYGSGFTDTGNTVNFGVGIVSNLRSFDGRGLSFTVPSSLSGYGSQPLVLGTYPVSVTNGRGERSNTVNFTVTSLTSGTVTPTLKDVSGPSSLAPGVAGTWSISVGAPAGTMITTSVKWGDENMYGGATVPQTTYMAGNPQAFTFSHAYQTAGTYTISFTVSGAGGSNTASATVTVAQGSVVGQPSLTSLSPNSGRVGSQITISGNNFSGGANVVHFGVGGSINVFSSSNTSITYTIPSYVSPCDLFAPGYACGAPATPVAPGIYPVYVVNSSGGSNVLYFTVTP